MKKINRDSIPYLTDRAIEEGITFFTTLISRTIARWRGLTLGEGCKFYGMAFFRRVPMSTIRIGQNCRFRSAYWANFIGLNRRCMISTLNNGAIIKIGDRCGFSGTVIAAEKKILLGNRIRCGANTTITDTDWHTDDPRTGDPASVIIEDDVWLGMNVTILKGVTIGKGSLVAANSLVTKSIPAGVMAAGQPAKIIRKI